MYKNEKRANGWRHMIAITVTILSGLTLLAQAPDAWAQVALEGGAVRADVTHRSTGETIADHQKVNPGNLSLEGTWAYTISGGTVRLQASNVVNRRASGTSGTIRLELWALPTTYSGGSFSGYKIGQTTLGILSAGFQYTGIDRTVTQLTTPPNGTWYMYMFVSEYTASSLNDGYSAVDWETFSSPWIIGSVALPDLVITNVFIPVFSASVNQRISGMSVTVRNSGTATAPAGARVKFYWSTNTIISTADIYSGWYCDLSALSAGQSTTCGGDVDAPGTAGIFYFGAIVNENGAISESSYANNDGYDPVAVNVTGAIVTPGSVEVVEYLVIALNKYFITGRSAEKSLLDAYPTIYRRTGARFSAYAASVSPPLGYENICRFYLPPAKGGSNTHFYGRPSDCNLVMNTGNPMFEYEGEDFATAVPINGICPASAPYTIYRSFNNRVVQNDGNHRYTNSLSRYNQMAARGWVSEGPVFCSTIALDGVE